MTAMISSILSEGSPSDHTLRITATQREFVAFALWVGVTFVQFSGDELLLYPLAIYFAVRAWQNRDAVLGLMARSWPIMLFPIWCLVSLIWAVESATALKQVVYLLLTMVVCYHVALNLSPRQIMYAVLLATATAGILNFLLGVSSGNYAWALFPHKNRMGVSMVILWIVSVSTVLDPGALRIVRQLALGTAGLAAFLVFQSDSATAMLLTIATGGVCVVSALLFRGGFWKPGKLALTCLLLGLTFGAASFAINSVKSDPVDEVLAHFGKDSTLTGRTALWKYAERQIEERPLLGVGAGGFWRYSVSPLVQRIYEEHHKHPRDHFNFHNSYYEIAVHQGLIGLAFVMPALIWAASWLLRGALTQGTMPHIFFLCTGSAVLVRSFTEADFYKPFVVFHMLVWIGALAAFLAERASRVPKPGKP